MAIIAGTRINWIVSPRIITIPAPVSEVTITDLQDTLTSLEDDEEGIVFPHLRNTSGGEALGGGVTVGWTMELQNAQVQFEGRTTLLDSGSATSNDALGRILIDTAATFITDSVSRGDTVFNSATGAMAAVITVDSETQLTTQLLSGGTRADWQITDTYVIYDNQQCSVTGGNLSAVDASGNELAPIFESPNVNVVRTASSSATNSDAEAIQYASYGGGVSINSGSAYTGTEYPVGNIEFPVNNITDALTIAEEKGFNNIYIIGAVTIDSGTWAEGYTFIGRNPVVASVQLNDLANVNNCEFQELTVNGVADNANIMRRCLILDVTSYDGFFKECAFQSSVTLGGFSQTTVIDSFSNIAGGSTPIFDMGGNGSAFAIRGYKGGLEIRNKDGIDEVSIDMESGQVIVAATVTAGTIYVRGIGKLTDNSGVGATVDAGNYLQPDIVMDGIERTTFIGKEGSGVSIHPTTGTDSVVWPVGTRKTPCKTVTNAHDIAEAQGFRHIYAMESININETMNDGYTFFGDNPNTVNINLDVLSSVDGGKFQDCTVTGKLSTGNIIWQSVVGAVTNLNGYIYTSSLIGPLTVSDHTSINKCFASPIVSMATVIIDFNSVAKSVFISQWEQGIVKVMNMVMGSMIHMAGTGGKLIVDVSCTGGMAATGGAIDREDNGTNINIMKTSVADQVWRVEHLQHNAVDTFGGIVNRLNHLEYRVFLDPDALTDGDGSQEFPFNLVTSAIDHAEEHNIRDIVVSADIILDRNLKNFRIFGIGVPKIETGGFDLKNTEFNKCTIEGIYTDSIVAQDCNIIGSTTINGFFENCVFGIGTYSIPSTASALVKNCAAMVVGQTKPIFDLGLGTVGHLVLMGYEGGATIINCDQPTDDAKVIMIGGIIELAASCTSGVISLGGEAKVIRNDAGSTVNDFTINVDHQHFIYASQANKRVTNEVGKTITTYEDDQATPHTVFDYTENANGEIITIEPQ